MAEVLGIISGAIALGQAIEGFARAAKFANSLRDAQDAFVDLQNQVVTLLGYSHQLHAMLDNLPASSRGTPLPDLGHLRGIADGLADEIKKLESFELDVQASSPGRVDARGRPKISKIKWARHRTTLTELRTRVSRWQQDLSHALSLFQTTETIQQRALVVDITNVVATGFDRVDTSTQEARSAIIRSLKDDFTQSADAAMSALRDNADKSDCLLERVNDVKDVVSRLETLVTQETQDRPTRSEIMSELQALRKHLDHGLQQADHRDHGLDRHITTMQSTLDQLCDLTAKNLRSAKELERQLGALVSHEVPTAHLAQRGHGSSMAEGQNRSSLISVHASLETRRRCRPSCNCQCHKKTTIGIPGLLSGILGSLLLMWNAAPLWRSRSCDHPKCARNSAHRVRLTYFFPRWMFQRRLAVFLLWDSLTGTGADIHMTMPRVISSDEILWVAIQENDISWVQKRIARKQVTLTEVDDKKGESLLMYALAMRRFEIASLLLSSQPKSFLAWQTSNGLTLAALVWRMESDDRELSTLPVMREVYALTYDEHISSTPIIDAVRGSRDMSLDTVLDTHHALINAYDSSGWTALHWAARRDDLEAVRLLLAYKADILALTRDGRGETCLHFATFYGSAALVQELLKAGSEIDARYVWGGTVVHGAAAYGQEEVLSTLLQAGADVLAVDDDGWNVFHYMAMFCRASADEIWRMIVALDKRGCSVDGRTISGDAALHFAVEVENVGAFLGLYRVGAKLDQTGMMGRTILHGVALWGGLEMLCALAELEIDMIDVELADDNGWTATDYFEERLDMSLELQPGQTRATEEEVAAFERLVSGMRERYHAKLGVQGGDYESDQNAEDEDSEQNLDGEFGIRGDDAKSNHDTDDEDSDQDSDDEPCENSENESDENWESCDE